MSDRITRRAWFHSTSAAALAMNGLSLGRVHAADLDKKTIIRDIGNRRELFVDDYLIEKLDGAALRLQHPQPKEKVHVFDRPWEGLYSGYETVLRDGNLYRMYYRGMPIARHSLDVEVTCVVESKDGIRWTRPNLGQYEVQGTKVNNVVLARSRGCHNLAPFVDTCPSAKSEQRYKALGGTGKPGLLAFTSPDGLHWKQLQEKPVFSDGAFDSQNNAFWSENEQCYVCYFRVFRQGKRWIARTTSKDFINWTKPVDLDLDNKPRQHLYTNQLDYYFRAPHICVGLPTRYFPGRQVVTKQEAKAIGTPTEWNYVSDCTDIVFASARGGSNFRRTFMEAFVRPGPDLRNWTSRANYAARGFVQTGKNEMSFYIKHNAGYPSSHIRRYVLRLDGFASIGAGFDGGTLTTKPLRFKGTKLTLNYSTSAAGGMRVEIRDASGKPIPGFSLRECPEIVGDRIDHTIRWSGGPDLQKLAGKTIRLHVQMRDADVYSLRFV